MAEGRFEEIVYLELGHHDITTVNEATQVCFECT